MAAWRQFDRELFLTINKEWSHRFFDAFMIFISDEKFWFVAAVAIMILAYLVKQSWKLLSYFVAIIFTLGATDLFTFRVLKQGFERLRPCHEFPEAVRLLEASCGSQFGFPSNHAANAMAFFVLSLFLFPSWRWTWLITPVLLVGYSRVYVGVHYPLDVLVGYATGALFGCLFGFGFKAIESRLEEEDELPVDTDSASGPKSRP